MSRTLVAPKPRCAKSFSAESRITLRLRSERSSWFIPGSRWIAYESIPQFPFLHLAIRGARQDIDEDEPPGQLVTRQARSEVLEELLDAGAGNHECHTHLAPRRVGYRNDGSVSDPGMGNELRLDLGGIDVDAPADEHLPGPAGDVDEAVLVAAGQVARLQKPVVAIGSRRGLGVVPVTLRYMRATDPHLADRAGRDFVAVSIGDPHLGEEHRPADRAGLGNRFFDGHGEAVHSHFRHAVALLHDHAAFTVGVGDVGGGQVSASHKNPTRAAGGARAIAAA